MYLKNLGYKMNTYKNYDIFECTLNSLFGSCRSYDYGSNYYRPMIDYLDQRARGLYSCLFSNCRVQHMCKV